MLVLTYSISLPAQNTTLDILLEKVRKAKTKEEKADSLAKLKLQLAQINKKNTEEANAIIKAKKKLPSKLFKVK